MAGKIWAIAVSLAFLSTTECEAVFVVGTSFENEEAGTFYIDNGDPAVDHDLLNNEEPGRRLVDSTGNSVSAGDMSFDAAYFNTRNDRGLTEGDLVGVTDNTSVVGSYTDGSQGYQLVDPEGLMRLTFETVDISGLGEVEVSLDYFIQETSWGSGDWINIFIEVDGFDAQMLNVSGLDIQAIDQAGWTALSTKVVGHTATLYVQLDSDTGNEALFIDNVMFNTTAIPEPSALLFCVVVFGGTWIGHYVRSRTNAR